MSRAGPWLARIDGLVGALRAHTALSERNPGVFDLGSCHLLHFHDTPGGIVADLFLAEGRARLPVASRSEQTDLLDRVEAIVEAIESRRDRRDRRRSRKGKR